MNKEQLEAIAKREAHCKPFGAAVTLSVGERDELVAICRLVLEKFASGNGVPIERITIRADELAKEQ